MRDGLPSGQSRVRSLPSLPAPLSPNLPSRTVKRTASHGQYRHPKARWRDVAAAGRAYFKPRAPQCLITMRGETDGAAPRDLFVECKRANRVPIRQSIVCRSAPRRPPGLRRWQSNRAATMLRSRYPDAARNTSLIAGLRCTAWPILPLAATIAHAITSTTQVRIAVARFDSTPSMPILARTEVSALRTWRPEGVSEPGPVFAAARVRRIAASRSLKA